MNVYIGYLLNRFFDVTKVSRNPPCITTPSCYAYQCWFVDNEEHENVEFVYLVRKVEDLSVVCCYVELAEDDFIGMFPQDYYFLQKWKLE